MLNNILRNIDSHNKKIGLNAKNKIDSNFNEEIKYKNSANTKNNYKKINRSRSRSIEKEKEKKYLKSENMKNSKM